MKISLKKIVVIIFSLIITHILCALLTGKYILLKNDISLESPIASTTPSQNWLISFGDGGVYEANQNFLTHITINKGFDAVVNYKKRHIDRAFYEQHKKILDQKRGSGYWLWKPYFILKTLNKMEEGEFLFYMDSGVIFLGKPETYIKKLNDAKKDILLFNNCPNRFYVKKDVYVIMDMDEKYRDETHIDAGLGIIIRNTKESRKFISDWLTYCTDERLITDMPSTHSEFLDFKDHRHDQAILSMLYHKRPSEVLLIGQDKDRNTDFIHHRRRELNMSLMYILLKAKISRYFNKLF